MKIIYIICHIILLISAYIFESICLHICTKMYIDEMSIESELNETYNEGKLVDIVGSNIKTKIPIPIRLVNYISIIPIFVFIFIIIMSESPNNKTIMVFNKTMIVGSILFLLKGILDVVTIIPDVSGISICESRLTLEEYNYLHKLNFKSNFSESLKGIIELELNGINGKKVSYCSDMILSGHINIIILLCLSIYEIIIRSCKFNGYKLCITRVSLFMYALISTCIIELDKFHYTVDILLSIILTILLWNNKIIEEFALNRSYEYYNTNCDIENQYNNCPLNGDNSTSE
jgi:hypothetical protein